MKFAVLIWFYAGLATAGSVRAETEKSWFAYASPESTAIVGMDWIRLRQTTLAPLVETGLSFPDIECLRQARRIVITSPDLLAIAMGHFPARLAADQALQAGLQAEVYRGLQLWLPKQIERPGIAQISEELILVGAQTTLQAAIDRAASKLAGQPRALPPATAQFQSASLWATAAKLPDTFLIRFLPLNVDGSAFEARVQVDQNISLEASFSALSDESAAVLARDLEQRTRPAAEFTAGADHSRVTLKVRAGASDFPAAMAILSALPESTELLSGSGSGEPGLGTFKFEITHMESSQPQIIRIFNLEEGTREIVLPLTIPTDASGHPLPAR